MNKSIYLLLLGLFFNTLNFAQITSKEELEIDKVFKDWKEDSSKPGAAVAIIKDGKIVYLKGFGSANLETKAKITPQTKFQLGELSKQFTTLAILLLEEQGKISLKDDIRKYLPDLPQFKHKITIEHLLNHTSGLYDIARVNYMINGSMNIDTQEKALKLIISQKALSFKPGTAFSFHESVTESVLMAEIVAKSSDQSFADFVKTNIFEPLEMNNSLIRDDSNEILINVAEPYQKQEKEDYKKNPVKNSVVGVINGYSSAEDLAKWYLNYSKPNGNLGKLIQKLDVPVKLSNGKKNVYYWGKMAIGREFTHPERGLPIFWNFGLQAGYGANVFRYLDQNIIALVLGNSSQYSGGLAHDAVDVLVEKFYPLPAEVDFKALDIKKLSKEQLKSFEGNYWFKEGYASKIFVENDTLRSKWIFSENSIKLVPLSNNTFLQHAKSDNKRLFEFKNKSDDMTLFFRFNESRPDVMKKYTPENPSEEELKLYTGTYYNATYGSLFSFEVKKGELVAKNLNHRDINFKPITKDVFTGRSLFFNSLEFLRDSSNKIQGFKMITDGINNLVFKKVN